MKLRNKKTGEIGDIAQTCDNAIIVYYPIVDGVAINPQHRAIYKSLAELNEEWEDYEKPEKYWFITSSGEVDFIELEYDTPEGIDGSKQIGNYFEAREEAELALRKLMAWKRLKDFGCGFILDDHCAVKLVGPDARKITSAEEQKSLNDDYNLLFGGKK